MALAIVYEEDVWLRPRKTTRQSTQLEVRLKSPTTWQAKEPVNKRIQIRCLGPHLYIKVMEKLKISNRSQTKVMS